MQSAAQKLRREEFDLFVIILWNIWYSRNRLIWHDERPQADQILMRSTVYMNQYKLLRRTRKLDVRFGTPCRVWEAPPELWLKINTDGAIFVEQGLIGMSSVIRDSTGNIYAARSDSRMGLEDPLLVELRAVHIAISWAIELNLSNIIFESDNAIVVRLLNKLGNQREDEVGVLVQDCLHHLQALQHVSIVHAPRACNMAAHTLARL